jgi:peptidoglycan-N-acetylglucosamine deacetylase
MLRVLEGAITAAAAAGGAAAVGWYAAMWPESQIFGPQMVAGRDPMEVALTYDDGPNGDTTLRLLDILAEHGTRVTFFLIGNCVRQQPEVARRVAAAGHTIGNHSMTHPMLVWQTAARIREELSGCSAILEDAIGAKVRYFRPPHGARRPVVLRTAWELGMTPVLWNVTGYDWNPISADEIEGNINRGIAAKRSKGRGSNVLLHDGGHLGLGQPRMPSLAATAQVLKKVPAGGMRFVTVDAWG